MGEVRKPFQGVWNIIRFNWHFYVLALGLLTLLFVATHFLCPCFHTWFLPLALIISGPVLITLLVSTYVYDLSGLYKFSWFSRLKTKPQQKIVNINAGFDETSVLIQEKFPDATLTVLDFYDPVRHTEVSIKRARKAYPPYPGTQQVSTSELPFDDGSTDTIFLIFAAHEIRDEVERTGFFNELHRKLKPGGQVVVVEHLRDLPNFLAYNIGFFHFHPKSAWRRVFSAAGFRIREERKPTPFVSAFILEQDGNTL